MGELLDMLKTRTKIIEEHFRRNKSLTSEKIKSFDNIMKSKETSQAQKLTAMSRKMSMINYLERLSSEIVLLYLLQMLALTVEGLNSSVNSINEQLVKSGILEKAKDIEDIKKLKKIIASKLKKMEEEEESRKKNLFYVD